LRPSALEAREYNYEKDNLRETVDPFARWERKEHGLLKHFFLNHAKVPPALLLETKYTC
jgi:hypothetical protein